MTHWNARRWVLSECEAMESTYDNTPLEAIEFVLDTIESPQGDYLDELTEDQLDRARRVACKILEQRRAAVSI